MAVVSPSSPETLDPKPDKPDAPENPNHNPDPIAAENPNPNPDPPQNPNPTPVVPPSLSLLPFAPSFRPLGMPPPPQYSIILNPNPNPGGVYYQNPSPSSGGFPPPGVPMTMYPPPPRYVHVPNGYMAGPPGMAPPGISRYPGPYPTMVRPGFPPRLLPPMGAIIPQIPRPPIPGIRGVLPVVTPVMRPTVPIIALTEKPQTTVYVGKIAPSVDNDSVLSLLRLCGPVKSWKRAQDPMDGTPKGFGFCEFEAAEGVLRALRLLTKLSIDGQELMLNINEATREYLERYVEKKTEREKLKEIEGTTVEKESESVPGVEKPERRKPTEDQKKEEEEESGGKEDSQKFGIVTDEDRDADTYALEKFTSMIEERIKNMPLPPPPSIQTPADISAKSNSEIPSRSREGVSDVDIMRSDKNDDETTSEAKPVIENDKPEASSPDRGRRHDRRSRERDRKHNLKREMERYERELERERVRREKERDMRMEEVERLFRGRQKECEDREREKECQRRDEKEMEKQRQRKRRNEITKDEDGEDDTRKKRRRSSVLEEKRRKRQWEKEEDLADRIKEEEEIAEAKRRAVEERKQEELKPPPTPVTEENENIMMQEDGLISEDKDMAPSQQACEAVGGYDTGDEVYRNSSRGELLVGSAALPDSKQNNDAPTKKLGFGLVGSGKRTTVPSVFHEEDDENVDDKRMRPLVPIDYSTEELKAVQTNVSSAPLNLMAAAEFAKRISGVNPKEEKSEMERERNGQSRDRTGHRERHRNDDDMNIRHRKESKERERGRERERERDRDRYRFRDRKEKTKTENNKLVDAKQLIDMIPKTKEELFAYDINWIVYDKHELHERMRPWISNKITEFLGEEEATLVDYIVSSTKEHVQASQMLDLLQSILDDEAEMFVLKMWRMLIFEIKKVEAGLSAKPRA